MVITSLIRLWLENTEVSCGKAGYNTQTDIVPVVIDQTTTHNFTLTQPNMVVNPLYVEETLNPGEYFTTVNEYSQ